MKLLINGILDMAVDEDLIPINPFSVIKVTADSRIPESELKDNKETAFDMQELEDLIEEGIRRFDKTGRTSALAILLDTQLGLRIGELSSLRWKDVNDEYLFVRRTESGNH